MDTTCGRNDCDEPTALVIDGHPFWGLGIGARLHMRACARHEAAMVADLRKVFGVGLDDSKITATRPATEETQ